LILNKIRSILDNKAIPVYALFVVIMAFTFMGVTTGQHTETVMLLILILTAAHSNDNKNRTSG
jgi:hypothetical protein